MKRVCKYDKTILVPYIDRFLTEIAAIDQASTQWTLANPFRLLQKEMTETQIVSAKEIMKDNSANHNDWIVLDSSMDTLGKWSKKDTELKSCIAPYLKRLSKDSRKSVAGRANKIPSLLDA